MPAAFGFDAAEVVPGVWLGGEKAAVDAEGLRERGIRRVLSVHEEPESLEIDGAVSRHVVRVHDMPAEAAALGAELPKAVSFVQEGASCGEGVLVHCMYGRSRSATVVIAWLMSHKEMGLSQALAAVRASRPQAGPNVGFMRLLGDVEESERGQRTLDQDEYAAQELLELYQDQGIIINQCREAISKIGVDNRGIVNAMVYLEEKHLEQ